ICFLGNPTGGYLSTQPCTSPHTYGPLSDGAYEFFVGAGSPYTTRKFTVDTSKPAPQLLGAQIQSAGPTLGVTVACDEACQAVASGSVNVPGTSRLYRLRSATRHVAAGGRAKLKLRVPKQALRAIRAALRHQAKLTAKIAVRVTDKAGNTRTSRRRVKLTR
ncbi:MAG: hypothetical protein QOI80_481, partial [Solirubrobacteraceae bacterium]|nr:hypothetical protein [Solirubrobacteraceae bacterium]